MTPEEKEDLIKILKNHSIEDDIKWFVVDRHKNILGFKTKPYVSNSNVINNISCNNCIASIALHFNWLVDLVFSISNFRNIGSDANNRFSYSMGI